MIKGGTQLHTIPLASKPFYTFGRQPDCDVVLDHPSSSRVHAVVQFRSDGASFIYDNASTHGTLVNKNVLKPKVYAPLRVGDVLRFGQSSRLYIFQGPAELMPQEEERERMTEEQRKQVELLEAAAERKLRVEQVRKAASDAARAEASWGLSDDVSDAAEVKREEEGEEMIELDVDWRSKHEKGQLTERQGKIADKILRKERTLANLKSELERIRMKESSQQLTEGQQHQIGRNQKRMLQLQEEIDEAEDILMSSVNESHFAKSGKSSSKRKQGRQEEDSDSDEFYDGTVPKRKKKKKGADAAESAESLKEKLSVLQGEKEKLAATLEEKIKMYRASNLQAPKEDGAGGGEVDDSLDAYVSQMKNKAKQDHILKMQESLSQVQQEIDRLEALIKIADPTG